VYFSDLYEAYFRHQAESHPELLHQDVEGQRVFGVVNVDEFAGDFRAGIRSQGYIMRLLEYSYRITDAGTHEVRKTLEGGFLVAHHFSNRENGQAGYLSAKKKAEQVTDEIIEKMIADSQAGHPLFYYSLNSQQQFQINPTSYIGDVSYVGYMCLFSWSSWWRNCITDPVAPEWTDGGVTPIDLL